MESTGEMAVLNRRLSEDPGLAQAYREAHERYLRLRGDAAGQGPGGSAEQGGVTAGGMPDRVKCLHALYAHEVADANPVGAIVRDRIEPLDCPGDCVTLRDEHWARVEGHPGFRGRR